MPQFDPFGKLLTVKQYKQELAMKQDAIARQNAIRDAMLHRQARADQNAMFRDRQASEQAQRRQMGLEGVLGADLSQEERQEALIRGGYLKEAGQLRKVLSGGGPKPSSVAEYEYYNALPEKDQPRYLAMKRAEKFINLGDRVISPTPGRPSDTPAATYETRLKPSEEPAHIAAKELAKVKSKAAATAETELADMEASLPELKGVVKKLSKLGKTATFTKAGQLFDAAAREAGEPTKGGVDRAAYIATVNNEVLPLLRQTFGAAFTAQEGESLKITLGNPNSTPAEKNAQLNAFIEAKTRQIKAKKRRLKAVKPQQKTPEDPGTMQAHKVVAPQEALDFLRANPSARAQFKNKYNYLPEGF